VKNLYRGGTEEAKIRRLLFEGVPRRGRKKNSGGSRAVAKKKQHSHGDYNSRKKKMERGKGGRGGENSYLTLEHQKGKEDTGARPQKGTT